MIALYVDDIPVACNNNASRIAFTAHVRSRLDIKDQGEMLDIIGNTSPWTASRIINLYHGKYERELLDKHDMTNCKPSCLPMDLCLLAAISKQTPMPLTGKELEIYPTLLGSLQYTAFCTRLYISNALNILGSGQANPTKAHIQALKKVLRFPNGTPIMSLTLEEGLRT
jgi:hypothetical protein